MIWPAVRSTDYTDAATVFWYWNVRNPLRSGEWFLCEAVYDGQSSVEGVLCRKVDSVEECEAVWKAGEIPLMADTEGTVLKKYRPAALIDAILAKESWNHQRDGRSNRWSWTGICGR